MKIDYLMLAAALPLAAAASPDFLPTEPPAEARLALVLGARGVQIYECRDEAWTLIAPEAVLLDQRDRVVGNHGAGPTWKLTDGSRVGGRVVERIDAPGGLGIPWLLLEAEVAAGGAFSGISHIQRLNTRGGFAPTGACVNQQSVHVAYTADYLFFRSQP